MQYQTRQNMAAQCERNLSVIMSTAMHYSSLRGSDLALHGQSVQMILRHPPRADVHVFDGVPPPYDKTKRMIIPEALRITRLRPGRKYTNLGRMCHEVGWKHWDTVKTLEKKRITKAEGYWAKKKEIITVRFPFLAPSRVFSVFAHLYMLLPTPYKEKGDGCGRQGPEGAEGPEDFGYGREPCPSQVDSPPMKGIFWERSDCAPQTLAREGSSGGVQGGLSPLWSVGARAGA
eukprot:957585-Rhodomonas_salina.3